MNIKIEILEVYSSKRFPDIQARARVNGESLCYNVEVDNVFAIPAAVLVRRSSWAGKYGDGGHLPF